MKAHAIRFTAGLLLAAAVAALPGVAAERAMSAGPACGLCWDGPPPSPGTQAVPTDLTATVRR